MNYEVTLHIPPETIRDVMVDAIEGNPMTWSWCAKIERAADCGAPLADADVHNPQLDWYDYAGYWSGAFSIEVTEVLDENHDWNDPDNLLVHKCGPVDLQRALRTLPPHHVQSIIRQEWDIYTADALLQLMALKEIVYG